MGWTERQAFFERIVAMRDSYLTSADDRRGVLSIADAIRYAETVMAAIELDIDPWLAQLDEAFGNDAIHGRWGPLPGHRSASDRLPLPTRSKGVLGADEADEA